MHLLYPCDPFNKKEPDETYAEEFAAARAAQLDCSLYLAEDFEGGEFRPRPQLSEGEVVIYRGWMLTIAGYAALAGAIEAKGANALTPVAQYRLCHHLPEWYARCEDLTPKTVFAVRGADYADAARPLRGPSYFVKDYVKSLTTTRGSVAESVDEIPEVVALIEKYRGQVEGGVCIREFEDLRPETEERYFVFKGRAFSRDGAVPGIVTNIAERIDSPFYSVDIVMNVKGEPRLIELGDGQVSDRKKWPAERFVAMFAACR